MDDCIILVDNSNVFIEGQKLSAKNKGINRLPGHTHDPCDPSWRIDFGSLLKEVSEGKTILKAILVGSTPPSTDSIWQAARDGGFEVIYNEPFCQHIFVQGIRWIQPLLCFYATAHNPVSVSWNLLSYI